ncbi:MAG: PAS domain S-box protein [Desulfosarcinaceae bacterium]
MTAESSPKAQSPWSHLRSLLRQGTRSIEEMQADSAFLMQLLEENHRLFNAMVDAFDGMIYICSTDYRIEFLNERMIQHLGYDATGELCYKAFGRSSVCPWCINQRILRGETIRWEVISPKDGHWYYVVNAPIRHQDGRVSKYAMMMDIHERKRDEQELKKHRIHLEELVKARTAELTFTNAQLRLEIEERKGIETTLRESQERYRSLFDGSRDAILISDAKGRILDVNDAATQLTGYTKAELIHKLVLDHATTSEASILHKEGRRIFTEFSSKKVTLAGIPCIHTSARDITARKQAEEALRQSESKYRELVQNANSMIIRFDPHGRLTFFNEYAQQFFGYREEEILGRSILDTILPAINSRGSDISPKVEDFFINPEKYKTNELENVRRNGEHAWVAWTNKPVRDNLGNIIEFLCVGVDITERKQDRRQIQTLNHELLKAQENERYKISRDLHDHIAQDLSSLKIGLQTLFDRRDSDSTTARGKVDNLVQILQRSISEVRNLAYDLRPPGLDQLGLVNTLFVYCEDFGKNNDLKIDFIAAGLDDLHLDNDTQINIYRLIQEALHNVKKHASAKEVTVRLVASSPNIILRIIDNGQGFDVKRWRLKSHTEKRMGLHSMVERVGLLEGTIDIRSRIGKGTGIIITIPIKELIRDEEDANPDH